MTENKTERPTIRRDRIQVAYKTRCHDCEEVISVIYPYCPWCQAAQ